MDDLIELVESLAGAKVALVGDFMLDRYLYGDAERISPEAPVAVLRVVGRENRPGGAASVAVNLRALGAAVSCIGVVGQDAAGEELLGLLSAVGAETAGLTRLPGRPTTVKERLVGVSQHRHRQQIIRIDEESLEPLPAGVLATIRGSVRSALRGCGALAIEDYDKGVLTEASAPQLIEDARSAGAAVLVDPARLADYRRYRGATLLTPNRDEARIAGGMAITDEESLARCAQRLMLSAEAEAVVITLDKEGAYLARRGAGGRRVPTRPRSVYDVAGAGDAVLAMLAAAVAAGCDLERAVVLANVAGGLEVEQFGVVPITAAEVIDDLRRQVGLRGGKIVDRQRLVREVARRRQREETVVFTNGCFDLIHVGHVRCLHQAREQGSCLIAAINSDASVRRLKGPSRPVIAQAERAEMLAALECVDYVTIFEEDTPEELIALVRPDVLVKGGDTEVILGQQFVEAHGGRVFKADLVEDASTTEIIDRILRNHDRGVIR